MTPPTITPSTRAVLDLLDEKRAEWAGETAGSQVFAERDLTRVAWNYTGSKLALLVTEAAARLLDAREKMEAGR